MIRIKNPAKTLERITMRLQQADYLLGVYEKDGLKVLALLQRRRITALKASLTRTRRLIQET